MHARKIKYNKIFSFILAMLFFVSALSVCDFTAHADANVYPFDNTDVMTDLESSDEFVLSDYYWDKYGIYRSPELVNFVEWCYSPFQPDDFALYIYFYNPQGVDIDEDNPSNRIQIASAYNAYPITRESVPSDYSTYPLVFCSMSMRENYEGMFYKFRVVDQKGADGLYIQDRVYSGERRYDVSGVVLADETGDVKEFGVGGTYYFSGYAAGYGPNEFSESTLTNTGFQPLETISVEVHPTVYRQDGFSSLGDGHQWDINSVYFSVPERYFTEYGDLQKIKAEWREYETDYIFVCKNTSTYNKLYDFLDVEVLSHTSSIPKYTQWYPTAANLAAYGSVGVHYNYNGAGVIAKNKITSFKWLFNSSDGFVSSYDLLDYMKARSKGDYYSNFLPILVDGEKIRADLFVNELSEERAAVKHVENDVHHKVVEIDANDKFDLIGFTPQGTDFFGVWGNILGITDGKVSSKIEDMSPIHTDVQSYINFSDSGLSNSLLIGSDDVVQFRTFYNNAVSENERCVVFNFAQTDYFSTGMCAVTDDLLVLDDKKGEDLNIAKETVFFDFKIIHLTFQKDGTFKVIPVTQNPIDVVNDITPPLEAPDWWKAFVEWLLGLLETIGAWGVAIVGVVALVLIITIALKLLQLAQGAGSAVLRIIFILAILAAGIAGGYYVGKFFFDIVISLGGLW